MAAKGMSVFTQNGEDYTINDPNIADEFDPLKIYDVGDYAYYQGNLYLFHSAHAAGAWNNNHAHAVKLTDNIKGIKSVMQMNNILWESGAYSTETGAKETNARYVRSVQRYPKILRESGMIRGWDEGKNASFMALWKNGTFVGNIHHDAYFDPSGTQVLAFDFDEFALCVYDTDYYDVNYIYIENLAEYGTGLKNMLTWERGVWSQSDGSKTSSDTYMRTTTIYPAAVEGLLNGWNYASATSFMSLYYRNQYVGCKYNNSFYVPGGSSISNIDYDSFALNLYNASTDGVKLLTNKTLFDMIQTMQETTKQIITVEVSTAQGLIDAVEVAKQNANVRKEYNIILAAGTYELWPVLDKSKITGPDTVNGRGLELPDYCNLRGVGSVTISCTIPESDNSQEHPYTYIVSTLNLHNTNNKLENIHFVGNNTKYCIHNDSGFSNKDKTLIVENCQFTHNGTESETYMPDPRCYGAGLMTGCKNVFRNCIFTGQNNVGAMWYVHTSSGTSNESNIDCLIENCVFLTASKTAIDFQVPWSTNFGGYLTVNNCWFATGDSILLRGVAPSTLFGGGNKSVTVENENSSTVYLVQ